MIFDQLTMDELDMLSRGLAALHTMGQIEPGEHRMAQVLRAQLMHAYAAALRSEGDAASHAQRDCAVTGSPSQARAEVAA